MQAQVIGSPQAQQQTKKWPKVSELRSGARVRVIRMSWSFRRGSTKNVCTIINATAFSSVCHAR